MKYGNIKGDTVVFVREKTKRTNTIANREIKAYLHPELKRIIETWGNKDTSFSNYIFPIDSVIGKVLKRRKNTNTADPIAQLV